MFDYAKTWKKYNEGKVYILYYPDNLNNDDGAISKFQEEFGSNFIPCKNQEELLAFIEKNSCDVFYRQIYGNVQDILAPNTLNFKHYVFDGSNPHGDIYVAISEWLGNEYKTDYLPYIVTPYRQDIPNYRKILNIASTDVVIGRYGAFDTFDIPWVWDSIKDVIEKNKNIKFLFMNTDVKIKHPSIISISKTSSIHQKAIFRKTCDFMLHARQRGETFGLSIAEYLSSNVPVISYLNSPEKNHELLLKDKGIWYRDSDELNNILNLIANKKQTRHTDYTELIKEFNEFNIYTKMYNLINNKIKNT